MLTTALASGVPLLPLTVPVTTVCAIATIGKSDRAMVATRTRLTYLVMVCLLHEEFLRCGETASAARSGIFCCAVRKFRLRCLTRIGGERMRAHGQRSWRSRWRRRRFGGRVP